MGRLHESLAALGRASWGHFFALQKAGRTRVLEIPGATIEKLQLRDELVRQSPVAVLD